MTQPIPPVVGETKGLGEDHGVALVQTDGPRRVQLSRAKGWKMPANTVSVARPGAWGNPFRVGDFGIPDNAAAVQRFREWMDGRVVGPERPVIRGLRGRNLACFCRLDQPCHADVLLELANASSPDETPDASSREAANLSPLKITGEVSGLDGEVTEL